MGVDSDMWLSMKTTRQEQAIAAYTAIQSGQDKVMADILSKMHYGSVSISRKFENWNDKDDVWSVNIYAHTFRGGIPFHNTAKHLLYTYPDFSLEGTVENDCGKMHKYDTLIDERAQIYSFHVEPEDWEAFLEGRYEDTTQGQMEIARRKMEDDSFPPKSEPEGKPDEKEINDPLPF